MAPTLLQLFPARVAIGYYEDASRKRTPVLASEEFLRALQKVFDRLGGALGPSVTDLATADDEDSGLEEFRHESNKALDALAMAPLAVCEQFTDPLHPLVQEARPYEDPMHPLTQQTPEVQVLQTEMNGLREEVAQLRSLINDLQQGTAI